MKKFITLVLATSLSFGQISAFNVLDIPKTILSTISNGKFIIGYTSGFASCFLLCLILSPKTKKIKLSPNIDVSSLMNAKKACHKKECRELNDINAPNCSKCGAKMTITSI